MEYAVTVQLSGEDIPVGTLYANVRRGVESSSFRYADSYLSEKRAFALSPDLPLSTGTLHAHGRASFLVFEDCMPDRWGRNLLLRAERNAARQGARSARTLFEHDMLAGVDDATRQGAIRIWFGGMPVAQSGRGVPREVSIPDLLAAADRAAMDLDADVADLVAAGSSLGGARPKASVVDEHGILNIAKFPKVDELPVEDVCAWEKTALDLARMVGIRVPPTRLLRIGRRSVILSERFDRDGAHRTPYLSGLSAIQGLDGESYSYLDLVSFLEEEGSRPNEDIRELWLRILFGCVIGNVDDHMRNHGFLRDDCGWRLSPMFDVNPTPGDNPKYLRSAIDFDTNEANPEAAIAACEWYRWNHSEALEMALKVADILSRWQKIAASNGISRASMERMASCFASGITRLKALREQPSRR